MGTAPTKTSTQQVRDIVFRTIHRVVNETLIQKTTTVDQDSRINQVISRVTFELPPAGYCPTDKPPHSLVISQEMTAEKTVGIALQLIDTASLATQVKRAVEEAVNADLSRTTSGGGILGWATGKGDTTTVDQRLNFADETVTDVTNSFQSFISSRIRQVEMGGQVMEWMLITQPCGDTAVTQKATVNMSAIDLAEVATDRILSAEESKGLTVRADARIKQVDLPSLLMIAGGVIAAGLLLHRFGGGGGLGGVTAFVKKIGDVAGWHHLVPLLGLVAAGALWLWLRWSRPRGCR